MRNRHQAAAVIFCFILWITAGGCAGRTEESRQEEKIVLNVLAGQSTSDAGTEDMVSDAVAEKFPDVQLEWECVDWGESFDDSMRARLSSGDIPDIIVGKSQDVAAYAETGILAEIHLSGTGNIYKEALDTAEIEGKLYGLPYNALYQGVIYNKDIFKANGLTVPKTRKELRKTVEILEQRGITAFAGHFQESWKTGNLIMQMMIGNIFSQRPDWGDDFRKGKETFTRSGEARLCMEEVKYIYDHSFEDASFLQQAESDKRFDEGKAAMYPGGCWSLQFVNQAQQEFHYGIFPYPNENGDSRLIRETNMTFMKSAFTRNGELVDDIFQLLMDDTRLMEEILEFTQTFSVRRDVEAGGQTCIWDDVYAYQESGDIVEAAVGNSQLIWNFQNNLAGETLRWLQGEITLEEVLAFADENREESKRQS
ncbi:MAG: extracellular solute-binding protein [Eubacteriales bacterium]|nr:extracellular solute-binding protein [Eubacteriales bacterium]